MILLLEDDADREAFQRTTPFIFFKPDSSLRTPTVWVSVEAYEEKIRADERKKWPVPWQREQAREWADLRDKVEALPTARGRDGSGGQLWRSDVLALFDPMKEEDLEQ